MKRTVPEPVDPLICAKGEGWHWVPAGFKTCACGMFIRVFDAQPAKRPKKRRGERRGK